MNKSHVHAWYALRRTIPPWRFDELLAEMVDLLPRYGVDEVIIKVDVEEFSHGQLEIEWVKRYQRGLFRVKEAMERLGIVYSLNPWITHGHGDRGRDSRRTIPGVQMAVGHDGARARACTCSLSPPWRKYIAEVWRTYAETGPRVIWVEDDIRTFNHHPVRFGCFCPLHLRAFSKRIGRPVTRGQLVKAILKPGKPHPWRATWLDLLAEAMIDTVGFLARTVHEVDPDIRLGLMSSGHHYHGVEGRRWKPFAAALADGQPLYSRAPMGNYVETAMRGLYFSHDSIKGTRHVMPAGTIEQTEVENYLYSRYGNSAVFTFLKMAISFAYGSHGVTLNLFDHCGSPMKDEPVFGRMLADAKPFLEALAKACQAPGRYRGVRLLHHEKAGHARRLCRGDDYDALAPLGLPYMTVLEAHGIATTYDDEPVINASGPTIAAFTDGQIRDMLRRGMLLDAVAAHLLVERGFGRQIGIRRIEPPRPLFELGPFGAEEHHHADFGGSPRAYLTLTVGICGDPKVSIIEPMASAQVISHVVDPDAKRRFPCMTAYENRLGGRVIVQALDMASTEPLQYCRPARARQMQHAAQWLARGTVPLLVHGDGAWPLAFRKDCDTNLVLGLFNLSLDDWTHAELDLDAAAGRKVESIQRLDARGRWRTDQAISAQRRGGRWRIRCDRAVSHRLPLVLQVTHAP